MSAVVSRKRHWPAPRPLADRFWSKVDRNGPTMPHMESQCWVWTASRTEWGYGRIGLVGGGWARANRVSWEMHFGIIADGLWVLHRCDNPPCVRPDHLFLGTARDNVADMCRKGRGAAGGEASPWCRLTDAAVAEIFLSRLDRRTLAARFAVHAGYITEIWYRKARADVTRHLIGPPRSRALPGSLNPSAKLNAEQVAEIRDRRAGGEAWRSIARAYAVSPSLIRAICTRTIWRHVA